MIISPRMYTPIVTGNGFLIHENENEFVLRDWATGRDRWRVTIPKAERNGWPGVGQWTYDAAISSDGRHFCIATPAGTSIRLQFWQDGKSTGVLKLPLPDTIRQAKPGAINIISPRLFLYDKGRSYLRLITQRTEKAPYRCFLYAFNGSRLVATGTIPRHCDLSPDGQSILCFYSKERTVISGTKISKVTDYWSTVSRISVEGEKLLFRDTQKFPTIDWLGYNEATLPKSLPKSWNHLNRSSNDRFAVFRDSAPGKIHIVNLATAREWEIQLPKKADCRDACPTDDGKACLVQLTYSPQNSPYIARIAEKIPIIDQFIELKAFLVLYRKDRREDIRLHYSGNPPKWWYPSPDGHSIILAAPDQSKPECLLYRY